MSRELDPHAVRARLAVLRALYVPETVDEGRARLSHERPRREVPLEVLAARRLAELRALCELARYLGRGRVT